MYLNVDYRRTIIIKILSREPSILDIGYSKSFSINIYDFPDIP